MHISEQCGIEFPYGSDEIAPLVNDFLSSGHRHHTRKDQDVTLDPMLQGWVSEVYKACRVLETAPGSKQALAELENIRRSFERAAPILTGFVDAVKMASASSVEKITSEKAQLDATLASHEETLKNESKARAELTKHAEELTAHLAEREAALARQADALSNVNAENARLARSLTEREEMIQTEAVARAEQEARAAEREAELVAQLAEREVELVRHSDALGEVEADKARLAETLAERDAEFALQTDALGEAEAEKARLAETLAERDETIREQTAERMEREAKLASEATRIEAMSREHADKIAAVEADLEATREKCQALKEHSEKLQSDLEARIQERDWARAHTIEVEKKYLNSTSWKITAPMRALKDGPRTIPQSWWPASKTIQPKKRAHSLGSKAERRFVRGESEATSDVPYQLETVTEQDRHYKPLSTISLPHNNRGSQNGRMGFNLPQEPEISIIIPVYNNIEYTLLCLRSLMEIDQTYSFEVIVMDDASNDATKETLSGFDGIRYERNEVNIGFLRNCNKGASIARGQYLVFLNNDTELDRYWLTSLRRTYDEHDRVGLVGSKLIYPDGRLQEAGGIIWQDASAWNWGRLKDPDHPAYNYVRDVDYVSGASLMVEQDLFRRLNWFDERYQNSYYEDTDLAMSVRAAGLRVIYQPKSIVLHHEGVSSGTDPTAGTKKYQVHNRNGFHDKWRDSLANHFPNGSSPNTASDRLAKGHVLIIDACTPTPDQDSGSQDMLNLIRIINSIGYRVHFIPQSNFINFGEYTNELQRMGVECVYSPHYQSVEDFLTERGDFFDHVFLTRVDVAHDTIGIVKRICRKAQLIFYTVDLHHLREKREAELTGNDAKLQAARETERRELAIIDQVHKTVVLSELEQRLLMEKGKTNVSVLPLIREIEEPSGIPFDQRRGILFIGGYQHTPNVDAVEWLVSEIWPSVRRLCSEMELDTITLHIYGSQMPDWFRTLECTDIKVHGFVKELSVAFAEVRLSVAPLRYGAGLKGKIASSFGFGVPVVGTEIAFEGIDDPAFSPCLVPNGAADIFAQKIVTAYVDEQEWELIRHKGREFFETNYSIAAVEQRVFDLLDVTKTSQQLGTLRNNL